MKSCCEVYRLLMGGLCRRYNIVNSNNLHVKDLANMLIK